MNARITGSIVIIMIALVLSQAGTSLYASNRPGIVNITESRISVTVDRIPLADLLREISKQADVDVYVSEGLQPTDITVDITDTTLEDALKVILRGYNYAGIYEKQRDDSWRIVSIRIYPQGGHSGTLARLSEERKSIPVARDHRTVTKTVIVSSGRDVITYGGIDEEGGVLVPSMTVPNPTLDAHDSLSKPWFALQKQLERIEFEQYQELRRMQQQVAEARDAAAQEALALAYAEKARKFYEMKKAHINKIEALKRIEESRELSKASEAAR